MDTNNLVLKIFRSHCAKLQTVGADTYLTRYAMLAALDELAAAMQDNDHDALLERIARVLGENNSALYADVMNGRTDLATAVQMAMHNSESALASVVKNNRDLDAQIASMRQQLLQLDADNASLTAELRTLRSWSTAPSTPDVP